MPKTLPSCPRPPFPPAKNYTFIEKHGGGGLPIHPPLRKNFLFSPPTPLHFVSEYGTIIKPLPRRPTQNSTRSGRLAQLVEHLLDVQEVTGSSPVPSTKIKTRGPRPRVFVLHGHRRGSPGSSPVLLRSRAAATGQTQLHRAAKRQSLRGRSLCLFVFCCRRCAS